MFKTLHLFKKDKIKLICSNYCKNRYKLSIIAFLIYITKFFLCLNKVRRCIQKTRLHNSIGLSKSGLLANSRREESSRRTKHLKSTTRDGDRRRRVRNGGDRSHGSFHASRLCYESRGAVRVCLQQTVFVCHSREESQRRLVHRQVRATLTDPNSLLYFISQSI